MPPTDAPTTGMPPPAAHDDDRRLLGVRGFAGVLGLALLLRAVWTAIVPIVPISDAHAYDVFARNLAAGFPLGWESHKPTAYWPVGMPFVYSVLYRVFPPEVWGYGPVAILNVAVSLVVVALSMALAGRWFGRRVQLITGVLVALWPMHIQLTSVLHSESLFTALLLGGMLVLPESRRAIGRLILAGLLFAAASYVRPTALLVPGLLIGAAFLRDLDFRAAFVKAGVIAVVMLAAILPWSFRNYRVFDGEFVLISTNGPITFWMGNAPGTEEANQEEPPIPPGMNEASYYRHLGRVAMGYVREDPLGFITRSATKAVKLHSRETIGVTWNGESLVDLVSDQGVMVLKAISSAYWLAVLGVAFIGLALVFRQEGFRDGITHPAVALWIYITAIHAIILVQDRYHFPVTPVIGALAALAMVRTWDLPRGGFPRRGRRAPIAPAVAHSDSPIPTAPANPISATPSGPAAPPAP